MIICLKQICRGVLKLLSGNQTTEDEKEEKWPNPKDICNALIPWSTPMSMYESQSILCNESLWIDQVQLVSSICQ